MVFYFTGVQEHVMYMGRDKHENEELIKYGLQEDVWFHVDDLSSAHVYLRLKQGQQLQDLDEQAIIECCTLVKANSIEGCKRKDVQVVYTPWANLVKTNSMEVGQVGFKDQAQVLRMRVGKDNAIINRLNRTKKEEHPDLAALQEARAAELRREAKQKKKQQEQDEKLNRRQVEEAKKLRSYDSLFQADDVAHSSNVYGSSTDQSSAVAFEDDFM